MTGSPSSLPGPSPLDVVIGFFETVFTWTTPENPARSADVKALIETSFNPGYTFNGQPFSPDQLWDWRTQLQTRFPQLVFRVRSAISSLVDTSTSPPTTAVVIAWTLHGIDAAGDAYELDGMNMLGMQGDVPKASTNQQLGDNFRRVVPAAGS